MSKVRLLILGIVALGGSALVAWFSYRALLAQTGAPPEARATHIVVAAQKLKLGTRLASEHMQRIAWPENLELDGSFEQVAQVIGRGVIVPMLPNEPILNSKLAPSGAGAGLTTAIPDGMRAVAVKVNDVIDVAGFVLPGTRVDVILTGSAQKTRETDTSKVILENVQVLASNQNVERDHEQPQSDVQVITLLVTPDDAQKLALASQDGRIQLALRNPLDLEQTHPSPVNKAALYAGKKSPKPRPVRRAPKVVTVVKEAPPPDPEPSATEVELIQGLDRQKVVVSGAQ